MLNIRSYDEYVAWSRRIVVSFTSTQLVAFALACIDLHAGKYGNSIYDSTTDTEKAMLIHIHTSLHESNNDINTFTKAWCIEQQQKIQRMGPSDDLSRSNVNPYATDYRRMLWLALQYLATDDSENTRKIAEVQVDIADYFVSEKYPGYTLNNMFTFPELQEVILWQEQQALLLFPKI
jgi:hypothetical protein